MYEKGNILQGIEIFNDFRSAEELWLYASDQQEEQFWLWEDVEPLTWEKWPPSLKAVNESRNYLVYKRITNFWTDGSENEEREFVCEMTPGM